MIENIILLLQNGVAYIRKHPQLLMTMLLIVVIPVAFLVSGQQFLNAARENQERLEKDRIGVIHDIFASLLVASGLNTEVVQKEIENITALNPDITEFIIAREAGDNVQIIASLERELVGTPAENANRYRIAHTYPNESIITPYVEQGTRFWQSYRLMRSSDGSEYYIYTETSLAHIDSLFASRITTAYYWLFGILGIVLLLVLRHVRLIDYAYLYNETKKANEMKDLFTNMVAHELRAPLTVIRGYASLIREHQDGSEIDIKGSAEKIEEASGRLVLIVNDLLDVARIHSGKLSIKNERTNIRKVIDDVVETMKVAANEKHINIAIENIPNELYINVDGKRLYQAFTNLVSNSIKYTNAGTITISTEERADRVEVRVKDTGMGIAAENQKDLFTPFFRVENTVVNQTVGTGLGMWITKQLIELMKGSIAVESIRGVGTHIVVTLPK